MTATYYVGDALEVMGKLPEKSVDLVLTSPPFLALRSYLPADHPDKALEGGSQPTPGAYIDWLIDVVEACDRVLAPHGSLCFELGDTYSGASPMYDGRPGAIGTAYAERLGTGNSGGPGWPLPKSLSLIPELFRFSLVYGQNPLTGRQTERWRLRNVIRWVRPNPPVGALGDKFRPATSELMVFCKSSRRFFDLDAVRESAKPYVEVDRRETAKGSMAGGEIVENVHRFPHVIASNPAGAPPLDWWNIPPGGFSGAHYAVFPPELCIKPIKAMCPEKVCRVCGEPSRRIVGSSALMAHQPMLAAHIRERRQAAGVSLKDANAWFPATKSNWFGHWEDATSQPLLPTPEQWQVIKPRLGLSDEFDVLIEPRNTASYRTEDGDELIGDERRDVYDRGGIPQNGNRQKAGKEPDQRFTDCGHDDYRPGLVLDPFAGSGTTLLVATGHGRDAIGIDLDERNWDLALERVGPFMLERGKL